MSDKVIGRWKIASEIMDVPEGAKIYESPDKERAVLSRGVEEKAFGHYICEYNILENRSAPRVLFSRQPFECYDDPPGSPFFFSSEGRYLITKISVSRENPESHQSEFMYPLFLHDLKEKKIGYHPLSINSHISIEELGPGKFRLKGISPQDQDLETLEVSQINWLSGSEPSNVRANFWKVCKLKGSGS